MTLHGRVFERHQRFQQADEAFKTEVQGLREHLLSVDVKYELFGYSQGCMVKPVYSVKGPALLRAIEQYLKEMKAPDTSDEYVRKVADALVLSGFITPQRETTALDNFAFTSDSFTAVSDVVADPQTKSVWSVQTGAIQAGALSRRKTGLLASLRGATSVKCYVVANDATHCVYVFDSDVSLRPAVTLDVTNATVEFDGSFTNGIKLITQSTGTEVFGTETKEQQDEWLNAFINAGAIYRETFNLASESVKSFYELKDYDMQGTEVEMSKYKGKVVLVVNVSSLCGLTPTNYPELTKLDEMYRDQGLEILAFPCNQFASQEPGTHEEIMEFVKQYNCKFQFFEKHDVNGANARPVFTYLKAKLPGSFGNFVKWNFTKFLVDRNGVPYKRYAPKDLPFSFEGDIKKLLAQDAQA
ncbi:TPA: hypothetical protein N0F65_011001 [Lagenidium giganteum]|uniref:Glutathione peroxidase n=1 Tax=Lagenidium giganteum TaxID=4803 RepID=A0AAV2Z933_9STRA|nr:TPA: hypothetical protein N0F65_011001 [Lagenidium giganteum]